MAIKRWILLLLSAVMVSVLAGCGGSTANVQNPPPPPSSPVTISVQTTGLTNGSVPVNGTVGLTATVKGTASQVGEGVSWYLTCQGGSGSTCGTLSSPSSASGTAITYTAPSTLSTNSMVTEIVAYAVAQQTANQVSPIVITTFDGHLLPGNYVLQAQGVESSTSYQFAGVITLDGQGNITGGEQTVNSGGVSVTDNIIPVGSSYFLGSDGRGTITLNTADLSIGGNGIETFTFVFLNYPQNNPQALISQMDLGSAATGASATGTMDLQTSTQTPAGSYTFVASGTDVSALDTGAFGNPPLAFGGIFVIASDQTISGVTDEIIDETQKLNGGSFSTGSKISSGPDTFGQVTFTLLGLLGAHHPKPVTVILTGYIVDATHIRLIETDTNANSGVAAFGVTGGLAIGQAPGSFGNFTNASLPLGTTYVFGITGIDLSTNSGNNGYLPLTLTAAGLFQTDGAGNVVSNSGYTDTFLLYNTNQNNPQAGAQVRSSFGGTYSVDSSGSGRTTIGCTVCTPATSITFNAALIPTYRPEFFLYLTGLSGSDPAALVLAVGDPGPSPNLHYPSIGTGVAYAQSTMTAAFTGPYGFSFAQENGNENDGTAQLNANPTSAPQVSGLADANLGGSASQDNAFLGTFSTPISGVPFSGTLSANSNPPGGAGSNVFPSPMVVDYYFIDPDHGFWVETDLVNGTPPSGQVSLGYYAGRTPVCTGCP
ncbi:MAG TPA: hypothetical protein VK828_09495 [Terriglobales bacterium]|nr:hypothetical protein [Terriglobales bacterium]